MKKAIQCPNCKLHKEMYDSYLKMMKQMIKAIPKSELKNLLIEMKILKEDYVTKEISLINKNG